MENPPDNNKCKCNYCGRSYINKNGKCLEEYNIRLHENKCKLEAEQAEKKKSTMKRKGTIDIFFKPMVKKTCNSAVLTEIEAKNIDNDEIGGDDLSSTAPTNVVNVGTSICDVTPINTECDSLNLNYCKFPINDPVDKDFLVNEANGIGQIDRFNGMKYDNNEGINYCKGYKPIEINNIYEYFPFQILKNSTLDIVFNHDTFHHADCKRNNYVLQEIDAETSNKKCSELEFDSNMRSIINRSIQPVEKLMTTNTVFLNYHQLAHKCSIYYERLRKSYTDNFNKSKKLDRLGITLDMHQRFLINIANHNIPRLTELVSVALRNNRSISYIVGKAVDAINGAYLARPSQNDKDLAYLILQFGGPSLLDICHRANALPSVSTAYKMAKKLKDTNLSMSNTIVESFKINTDLNPEKSTYAYSVKVDETFISPNLRYDGKTDEIKGLCYQHGIQFQKIKSYEEAETLSDAIKDLKIHVPKECMVISGCAMNKISSSDIIVAWPSCDKQDFNGQFDHFNKISNEYVKMTGKSLLNFSTDGDGTRRQVFNKLLSFPLDKDSPIGQIIAGLPLVDLECGCNQETVSYDPKHLVKRCWTFFIKENVCVTNVTIIKEDLKALFRKLPCSNDLEIDGFLFPQDKQNVPTATKFLLTFIEAIRNIPKS